MAQRCCRRVSQARLHYPAKPHGMLYKRMGWQRPALRDDDAPASMSIEEACKVLNVQPSASFDQVLSAKNKKLNAVPSDRDAAREIEAAYDVLFMLSMKKRLSGTMDVSTTVRYADVPSERKKRAAGQQQRAGGGLLPGGGLNLSGLNFSISTSSPKQMQIQAAVFVALAGWALTQALLEGPEAQASDVAGLQLALAFGYSCYSLKENKGAELPRAIGISAGLLLAGAIVGGLIQQWLRLDIVPLGAFSSPGVFVTEFAIVTMAAGALLLK